MFFEPFCGVFSPGESIDIDIVDPCFNGFPSSFFSVEPEQDIDLYVVTGQVFGDVVAGEKTLYPACGTPPPPQNVGEPGYPHGGVGVWGLLGGELEGIFYLCGCLQA